MGKYSDYDEALEADVTADDLFLIVDVDDLSMAATGTNKKVTVATLNSVLVGGLTEALWSQPGVLYAGVGPFRYYAYGDFDIIEVRATVGTAPDGDDLILDVNKNGITIFTTQANRPTVLDGTNTATSVPDDTVLVDDDFLTIDIDQIGSDFAGANLAVQIVLRRTA